MMLRNTQKRVGVLLRRCSPSSASTTAVLQNRFLSACGSNVSLGTDLVYCLILARSASITLGRQKVKNKLQQDMTMPYVRSRLWLSELTYARHNELNSVPSHKEKEAHKEERLVCERIIIRVL
jgi:hypothetical protein